MPAKNTLRRTLACSCVGTIVGFMLADRHPHALMSPEVEMVAGALAGLTLGLAWSWWTERRAD